MVRQGDLLFIPAEKIQDYFLERAEKEPKGIIEEGEATGHHHRLADLEAAEVFHVKGWSGKETMLRVGATGVSIVHEEHKPVQLPEGVYQVNRAREFDYLTAAARYVVD